MCNLFNSMQIFVVILLMFVLQICVAKKANCGQSSRARFCRDGRENLIEGKTDTKKRFPLTIHFMRGTVYTMSSNTSCYKNRPTVLLPGYAKLTSGEMTVPKVHLDLVKSGDVKMTIRNPNYKDPLCLNGVSQYLALPSSFCHFNLCEFIGKELCEFLQKPGKHSIREMEQKIGFNSTLKLPDPPSFFGISLLDLFAGEFHFIFLLETEGKPILGLEIPTNIKYIPIGMEEEEEEEEEEGDCDQ